MGNKTVNISFQDTLLKEIDEVAKAESRSRSELIREAARAYITRQNRWDSVFALGSDVAVRHGLTEADVMREVRKVRRRRRVSS